MQFIHNISNWCERFEGFTSIGPTLNTNTLNPFKSFHLFGIVVALVIAASVMIVPATAQDDDAIVGYRILGEEIAGPYTIQLQMSPVAPIIGITRFAVRVRETVTGEDIDDAIVRVFASPSEQGEKQYSPALNSHVDLVFYLAQLDVEFPGIWAIDVEVDSELGSGTTVMSIQVDERGRSGTGNGWGQALFGLVVFSFVVGITWVWYSSKKALKRRERQS